MAAAVVPRAPSSPPLDGPGLVGPAGGRKSHGRAVIVAKDGGEGPAFPLFDSVDIGRLEGDVTLHDDPYLSPRHARLFHEQGRLFLRDLASLNGVYLRLAPRRGGEFEAQVELFDQDLILVGQQVLRFEIVQEDGGLGAASQHGTLVFGTPLTPRYARLSQRTVEGITRDVIYLRKMETVLGRESGDVIFSEDLFLSRRHAAIRVDPRETGTRFHLVDLGSSNGTFVRLRKDVELTHGDQFRIGQQLFRIELDAASRAA